MPQYIHSDRGTYFMSVELKSFLKNRGIWTSRTTPRNPQGNGQVERLNAILWKTISRILKSGKLPTLNGNVCDKTPCTLFAHDYALELMVHLTSVCFNTLFLHGYLPLAQCIWNTSKYNLLVDEVELSRVTVVQFILNSISNIHAYKIQQYNIVGTYNIRCNATIQMLETAL